MSALGSARRRDRSPTDRPTPPTIADKEHPMELTGAQALIKSLEMQHVEVIFGLPGGAILPVYDPILDSSIRHILVRHEQGAGHMAEGYAQVTGRPGVAMVTSRSRRHQHRHPARRRLHGLDPAGRDHRARWPPRRSAPTPSRSATSPASPWASPSTTGSSPTPTTSPGWSPRRSTSPPPAAPVPCSSTSRRTSPSRPWSGTGRRPTTSTCPGYRPVTEGDPALVREAAELLLAAERPVIYAGGGILKARAADALRELAERTGIPVVTTLMARGASPTPTRCASACRACTATTPRSPPCSGRTCSSPSAAASTTG